MILGMIGTIFSIALFGTSQNFAWAIAARFLWGLLNGNIGVAKTYMAEVSIAHILFVFAMLWTLLSKYVQCTLRVGTHSCLSTHSWLVHTTGWYTLLVSTHSWLVHTPGQCTLLISTHSLLVHTPGQYTLLVKYTLLVSTHSRLVYTHSWLVHTPG